jgi:hypothetical protein
MFSIRVPLTSDAGKKIGHEQESKAPGLFSHLQLGYEYLFGIWNMFSLPEFYYLGPWLHGLFQE